MLYKLKHIPTGLYFKQRRHRYVYPPKPKSFNLHPVGKVYTVLPSLAWLKGASFNTSDSNEHIPFKKEDWVIVVVREA